MMLDLFLRLLLSVYSLNDTKVAVEKKLYMNTYNAVLGFYSFPKEIQNHIKLKFIELIRLETRKLYFFKNTIKSTDFFTTYYSPQVEGKESTVAYDTSDPHDDRYVVSHFFTENITSWFPRSPYYYLTLYRCNLGPLWQFTCYQKKISSVTFKNNIIKAYYKKDEGYDVQEWNLNLGIMQQLDCLQLALLYNCFENEKKVNSISLKSPMRKIYDTISVDIKNVIFLPD